MKCLVLFILCLFAVLPLDAQQIDFAPVGAKWSYYNNGWPVPEGIYEVECVGDTLIENRPCRKLCCLFPASFPTPPTPLFITQSEDSVFYVYKGAGGAAKFDYLFKTSFQVGDSVMFPELHLSDRWYQITGIDTLTLNGHTVKCYTLYRYWPSMGGWNTHIYDLFGPYLSFMAPWLYDIADGFIFELRSYEDPNFPKVTFSEDNCDFTLATSLAGPNTLKISPNPAMTQLSISLPQAIVSEKSWVRIFDMSGRTLLQQNISGVEATIDVSNLPRGLYYLLIQGQKAIYQHKFIKN